MVVTLILGTLDVPKHHVPWYARLQINILLALTIITGRIFSGVDKTIMDDIKKGLKDHDSALIS